MVEYRSFRNADPPRLLKLWHDCELGRGAALGFHCDALDMLVLAEPYFDRQGLIVACSGDDVVGYAHAGFGAKADDSGLDFSQGVLSAVMVRPDFRRQGIGRELVRRAETYLLQRGARELFAGESGRRNPFYLGLYGGSESVGFLESDKLAAPFLQAIGYAPAERYQVCRRDISQKNDPFDPRLISIRRKLQLGLMDRPPKAGWWWMTREGRMDSLCFCLTPGGNAPPTARVTCWGMDVQSLTWRQRTVGLVDLCVGEKDRRQGYAKALIVEVMRRLRDELVTHVDLAARESDPAAVNFCRTMGFDRIDTGVVYRCTK